jgi:hypothetical protein
MMDSARIDVTFSRLNLRVDSILSGTMRDVDVVAEASPGRVAFTVRRRGPDAGTPGSVGVLYGTAFSAIPDSTPLTFASVSIWSRDDVNVAADDGSLVVDACGPRFLVRHGALAVMRIVSQLPVQEHLRIAVSLGASDDVRIDVVDLMGTHVAETTSVMLPEGETLIDVPLPSAIASGWYIVRVATRTSGSTTATVPVVR